MNRPVPIIQGEYYHVCGRGNNKQDIFLKNRDYIRFMFLVLYFQSPEIFRNISRNVDNYQKSLDFRVSGNLIDSIVKNRFVELITFTLMPNHYHFILYEVEDGGISRYMQRILDSYSKYFNTKYDRSGHLFQGPFKAIHIGDDNQLSYTSAYIHRNPNELKKWEAKEVRYPWSSYQDYVKENRWGRLMKNEIIIDKFENVEGYDEFVQNSGAKTTFDFYNL